LQSELIRFATDLLTCVLSGDVVRVTYRYIRPLTVLFVRALGPYNVSAPRAWAVLGEWLERKQARKSILRGYGFCRDNPLTTPPDHIRYDACIPLMPGLDVDIEGGVGRQTLRGGAYAVYTHIGHYEEAGEIFSQLYRHAVPNRGLSVDPGRPFVSIYLNDPLVTRAVHRRTELCVPILPLQFQRAASGSEVAATAE
jgi:AraC family transcriptional regulator